ncbi:hypothetical protein [Timonella sp. A28]|uniref:hypothetical protein n=1 Tax=Timonella sp. A28 TaxID=3442640 RepID=UPI003EB7589C
MQFAIVNGVLVAQNDVTPEPLPTTLKPGDELRPGLNKEDVSPGLSGFLAIFFIAAISIVLFLSMTKKLRKVAHKSGTSYRAAATFDGPGPRRKTNAHNGDAGSADGGMTGADSSDSGSSGSDGGGGGGE